MKLCRSCGETLELSEFNKNAQRLDGLHSYCKQCSRSKVRNSYQKNHEHYLQYKRNYSKTNPEKYRKYRATRRAREFSAKPSWLTKDHEDQIDSLYRLARDLSESTEIGYHVDHIVPLNNNRVCGLHVPWNLRVITQTENLTKGNTHCND